MRTTSKDICRLALLALAVAATSGCVRGLTSTPGDAPNLEEWVANVKARPAPPLDPLPVMQQFETFEYAAQDLRDPRGGELARSPGAVGVVGQSDLSAGQWHRLGDSSGVGLIGRAGRRPPR